MLIVDVDGRSLTATEWARTELPRQVVALADDVDGLCAVARVVLDEGLAAHAAPLIAGLRAARPAGTVVTTTTTTTTAAAAAAAAAAADEVQRLLHALTRAHADALRAASPAGLSPTASITSIPLAGPVWAAIEKGAPVVAARDDAVAVVALADEAGGAADVRAGNVVVGDVVGVGAAAVLAEHVAARVDVSGVVVVPVVGDVGLYGFVSAPDIVDVLPLLPRPLPRLVVTGARLARAGGSRVVLRVYDLRDGQETVVVDAPSLAEACTPLVRAVATLLQTEKHRAAAHAPLPKDLDDDFAAAVGALFVGLCVATGRLQEAQVSSPNASLASTLTSLWASRPTTLYAQAAQTLAAALAGRRDPQPRL